MAELILSPIADKVIGSLASVVVQEIATLWGVNEELEGLETTISLIRGVLLDAEEKQLHNNGIRIWLKSLAHAVHEAGDLMDEFDTEALRRRVMPGNGFAKQVRTFFSSSNQLAFRHKMARKIKEIKKKLAAASNDRSFLLLEARSPDQESRVARKRETHSFVRQDEVIGRDGDREAIVKLLLESQFEENVSVIPIVGMGGLGKTTLAQSVFNHERVQQHFELKAWVCVSDPFDLKVIVQTIIKSVDPKYELREVEIDQLQKDLRKMLGGKRYLLVLDDVWEENRENWLKLKTLLIGGADGSRVVVTTRSKAVAMVTSPIEPYQLGVLDEEKSWSLFKKMAFRQELEEENLNLVVIGKEIVKRCGGIPLAIRTIGSTMYCKHSETEWSSFNKEFSKLPQGDDILPTLRLSYDNLTSHLKQCFLYCRLFPKDYHIHVPMLIQLWMAQGFLKLSDHSHDQCLEDVGYRYFVDLSEISFFQEIEIDEFGIAESCKMHDLIHDLAIELAGEGYDNINSNSEKALNKNVRHVSLSCFDVDLVKQMLTSFLQDKKIRTVLSLTYVSNELKPISSPIISNFNQIRALGLYSLGNALVPESINRLKFVRYLDLSDTCSIKTLPKSITNLLNLQTLKLNNCSKLQELPRDLKKLVNLRHLEIRYCKELRYMPVGLGQLTNLTTLTTYVLPKSSGCASRSSTGGLKELMALSNLRGRLAIDNLKHGEEAAIESKSANLKEKQHLESLYFSWDSNIDVTEVNITRYEMSLEGLQPHPNLKKLSLHSYGGVKFSSWLQSLTNLVSLSLSFCENCKHLDPVLTQSNKLKKLALVYLPSLEYITNSYNDNNLLTSLQILELDKLPSLKGWWGEYVVSEEENQHKQLPSFSQLTKLSISDCPNLSHMPLYPHLEGHLSLWNASLKPFQQTLMLETCSFSPLSKLKSLLIGESEDLECLPGWFKSLTSLTDLEIQDCPQLKDLCPGILYLTSLIELKISECEELVDTLHNAIMWKALSGRLQHLKLRGFGKMESLPEGIQHVTSLQYLELSNCVGLATIPEWIGNLRSLKKLECYCCLNLTSLPEGIRSLTSLETLEIQGSPILLKRCQREIGEDWPKIAHIPHLDLSSRSQLRLWLR